MSENRKKRNNMEHNNIIQVTITRGWNGWYV